MAYVLWVKCLAEVLGVAFAIWLAQSNVANELLSHTKGHGMGFGWLSFGYGLAFGFGVLLTGWISAYFNPALALAAWINSSGITSASEYFAIAFSTICGGFLGGLMVFLQFWPHFQIVPKPPMGFETLSGRFLLQDLDQPGSVHDPMEQPTYKDNTGTSYDDYMESNGEGYPAATPHLRHFVQARVSPAASAPANAARPGSQTSRRAASGKPSAETDLASAGDGPKLEGQTQLSDKPAARVSSFGGRHTPPVRCSAAMLPGSCPSCRHLTQHQEPSRRWAAAHGDVQEKAQHCDTAQTVEDTRAVIVLQDPNLPRLRTGLQPLLWPFQWALRTLEARMERTKLVGTLQMDADNGGSPVRVVAKVLQRMEEGGNSAERAMAGEYAKAIKADQVAKLLCFCTRPAIYSPMLDWLCEFMSTIALIVSIFVFQTQLAKVYPNTTGQYNMISTLFVGVLIILLVVGLGGPTGVAMSPARDMGPRLAHWVLPIRGKGSSEFLSYSWTPLTASMTAAVPAAFIVRDINHLIATGAPAAALATVGSG